MKSKVRIHGISKKARIIIYLSSILILCVINPCSALAWSAGGLKSTIASIVVSMLMSSGAGVTNMDWLTELNTAYGVESSIGTLENAISQGLLTESGGTLIDTGLSEAIMQSSSYTNLGLDDLFSTYADDALIQSGTVVASGGANLATEAIGTLTLGTVGQAFIAVGAGIGLGVLAHHFIEKYAKPMFAGQPIDSMPQALENLPDGYRMKYCVQANNYKHYFYLPNDTYAFSYIGNNSQLTVGLANLNDSRTTVVDNLYNSQGAYSTSIDKTLRAYGTNNQYIEDSGFVMGDNDLTNYNVTQSDMVNIIKSWKTNGTAPDSFSPDVIGTDGNQKGSYSNENGYAFPYISPYYNPNEKGLEPIPMDEYMDFAADAIDNTENGDVDELQGNLFDNFINPYLQEQQPVVPEPDPDYTDPDVIPDQPDYTDKEPVSAEDVSEADAYTAPDLMDRFPFCIPNDILAIFRKFKVGREAPYIEWNFKYDAIGLDYTFELDLSIYDDVAEILRLLELIAFVVGLGVATRKLIGA